MQIDILYNIRKTVRIFVYIIWYLHGVCLFSRGGQMKKQRIPEVSWNAKDGEIYERLSDNEVFADLFNGVVFQGEEIIKPEYLEEMNEKKQL